LRLEFLAAKINNFREIIAESPQNFISVCLSMSKIALGLTKCQTPCELVAGLGGREKEGGRPLAVAFGAALLGGI
jgi:hypothetical protein